MNMMRKFGINLVLILELMYRVFRVETRLEGKLFKNHSLRIQLNINILTSTHIHSHQDI